jgi:uncharacterized protein (TIGR03067 family)
MRRSLGLLGVVGILLTAGLGRVPAQFETLTEAQKTELRALSGTFKVIVFERDGKQTSREEMAKMRVVQNRGEWSFAVGNDVTRGRDTPYPFLRPRGIDCVYLNGAVQGQVVKGIYKLEGNTITYCWADPGQPRPNEFATKADSGLTLMKFLRVNSDEK